MTKYPYILRCTKCDKDFVYKSEHAMLEQREYNKLVATAVCPKCKKRQKKIEEFKEVKESLSLGERLYCLEQDIEEYIQHNGLEADKELDFILKQVIEIREIIQKGDVN